VDFTEKTAPIALFRGENFMANYGKRIVAFIDILGFKNLVKASETDGVAFNTIHNLLRYLFSWQTGQPNVWDHRFIQHDPDVQKNRAAYKVQDIYCICFSDSLAVSMPYNPSLVCQQFSTFISNLAHIGSKFIQVGVPIRGGIAKGNLVHDSKGIIYGPAFNEAVEIEKNAEYPRIILSAGLIKLLVSSNSAGQLYPYRRFLTRFADGCVGFHQMKFFEYQQVQQAQQAAPCTNEIPRAKDSLLENLDEHLCDPKVFNKYKWLTDEFNKLNITANLKIKTDLTDGGQRPHNLFYKEVNPAV
jgi:hypothetical protein